MQPEVHHILDVPNPGGTRPPRWSSPVLQDEIEDDLVSIFILVRPSELSDKKFNAPHINPRGFSNRERDNIS